MTLPSSIEIGIVRFPGVQLAAIYGLIDLFKVADRFAVKHHNKSSAFLRVSQWQIEEANGTPVSVDEESEEGGGTPTVLLMPPRLGEQISTQEAAPFVEWLLSHHRAGTTLCSVCGGAFLLAETGLLSGRSVTTHWDHADLFRQRFPDVHLDTDRLVIDDGDIISAGGLMAWIDLGLKLVDRFLGPVIMAQTARYLLVDPPGREQRYYSAFSPNLTHGDAAVLKTQHWLQASGAKDAALASLVARSGLEERTFLRRFRKATGFTAIDYCQRLRVGRAREMLQFSNLNVESIAWDVGYSDTGAFRKIFIRITGLTPGEYRQRFNVNRQ
ncbi:transcriptional regulator containing an amidase domain and an AraC-type DNA-binding HTH domain [Pseudomonas sp. GM18]|uniref:GlxA family transcriptional regulator n=1 Tax=Pseudomonas sp. GM18 TaxID=1144324 RepID=UPI0002726599|nr:GlxA family transcriptional regulator [Pseudomonas sp. GM18]EJM21779.1 transcriptional regulator containing an amidase domain and an AraC-type DNA-binding HTH domain [Pseudomonas sp. GM18]